MTVNSAYVAESETSCCAPYHATALTTGGGVKATLTLCKTRVSSKWKIKIFGSNRNKPKQDLFRVCFGLFRETKTFLFRFVSVFRTCIETIETNRTVSKRTETILNFLKNTWIFSLLKFTITIQSNQKDIIRFCWSLYCYFYNCTVQYINVNIFRNLRVWVRELDILTKSKEYTVLQSFTYSYCYCVNAVSLLPLLFKRVITR